MEYFVEYARIGGYCGVGSEFINCVNEIDITYNEAGNYIGGIVGECNGNLTSCVNKGFAILTPNLVALITTSQLISAQKYLVSPASILKLHSLYFLKKY